MRSFFALGILMVPVILSGCGQEVPCKGSNQVIVPQRFENRAQGNVVTPTPTPTPLATTNPAATPIATQRAPAALTGDGCSTDLQSKEPSGCTKNQFDGTCD